MNKNKIVLVLFWSFFFLAIALSVYRFFIARNFLLVYQVDCNPAVENCFVGRCDEDLGECTGNEEDDVWYYSKVKKMAYNTKRCNPKKEECPDESVCDKPIEQKCWIEKCHPENLGENEECITPEEYLATHPEVLKEEGEVNEKEIKAEKLDEVKEKEEDLVDDREAKNLINEKNESLESIIPTENLKVSPSLIPTPTQTIVPY